MASAVQEDIKDYEQQYEAKGIELIFLHTNNFTEKEVVAVKKEIEDLKQQLLEEKRQKQNKGEYLTLAKLINQHPKRGDTLKYGWK